jgi:hypothetical protein
MNIMKLKMPVIAGEPTRLRYLSTAQARRNLLKSAKPPTLRHCGFDKQNHKEEELDIFMDTNHLHIVSGRRAFKLSTWDNGLGMWQKTIQSRPWTEWVPTLSLLSPSGKPDTKFLANFVYGSEAARVGKECPLLNAYLSGIPTVHRQLAAPFERAQWVVLRAIAQDASIPDMIDLELSKSTIKSLVEDILKRASKEGYSQSAMLLRASLKRHLPEIRHAHS